MLISRKRFTWDVKGIVAAPVAEGTTSPVL